MPSHIKENAMRSRTICIAAGIALIVLGTIAGPMLFADGTPSTPGNDPEACLQALANLRKEQRTYYPDREVSEAAYQAALRRWVEACAYVHINGPRAHPSPNKHSPTY
jgi:hypothetical protein